MGSVVVINKPGGEKDQPDRPCVSTSLAIKNLTKIWGLQAALNLALQIVGETVRFGVDVNLKKMKLLTRRPNADKRPSEDHDTFTIFRMRKLA